MQTYAPLNVKARVFSALLAVVASTVLLGGQLGLFAMVSHDADVSLAKAKAAASPASGAVVQRQVRPSNRG